MNGKRNRRFWTQAAYDFKRKEALVQVYFMGQAIAQLSPQDAVDFSDALLQASSNAITDAYLISFLVEHEGASEETIRQKLMGLAEWRGKHEPFMGADRDVRARK